MRIPIVTGLICLTAALNVAAADVKENWEKHCVKCHGADGKGDEETPKLVGLEEAYFVEQLQAFKYGARKDEEETMLMYTEELSDQDMADLAAYFATLPAD